MPDQEAGRLPEPREGTDIGTEPRIDDICGHMEGILGGIGHETEACAQGCGWKPIPNPCHSEDSVWLEITSGSQRAE